MPASADTPSSTLKLPALPPLVLPNGTLELLKWLAVVLMTIDHTNKYVLGFDYPWMFHVGRLAMPIFTVVLAYNLARPGAFEKGIYKRTFVRLLLFGVLSTPTFIALGATYDDSIWPMNIMFLFASIVACVWLIELGGIGAKAVLALIFVVMGFFAEYFWFGLGFGIAVWYYTKRPTWTAAIFAVLCCATLNLFNNLYWSLLAIPLVFLAPRINLRVPRLRLAFYAYYPLHLAVLWWIQTSIGPRIN
jgi:TraX protein